MRIGHNMNHPRNDDQVVTGGTSVGTGFTIAWQNGPLEFGAEGSGRETDPFPNGAFVEDVIEAALWRINAMQGSKFQCAENAEAISHLHKALEALDSRTKRREAEGLHGTHKLAGEQAD